MYPYPPEFDSKRCLMRTHNDEAIDLTTGDKYRLQKVDDANFGLGAVFGLFIGFIFLLVAIQANSQPIPLPHSTGETTEQY